MDIRKWTRHTTPSDFGFGGGRPSHPRTPRPGWPNSTHAEPNGSLKSLLKGNRLEAITYRQQSIFSDQNHGVRKRHCQPSALAAKPRDAWMRKPFAIQSLLVSGKLNDQTGGPPDSRTLPTTQAYAPEYNYITPADSPNLWRRMQSTASWSARPPNRFHDHLGLSGSVPTSLPKGSNTTTPLQSLALYKQRLHAPAVLLPRRPNRNGCGPKS
jgi:hypothetical protein